MVGEKLEELSKQQQKDFEELQQEHPTQYPSQPPPQHEGFVGQQQDEHPIAGKEQKEEEKELEQQQKNHIITTQVTSQQQQQDSSMSQWLCFDFEKKKKVVFPSITLQYVIMESLKRAKKDKTIHHLNRSDSRDLMANIAAPVPAKEGEEHASLSYQIP